MDPEKPELQDEPPKQSATPTDSGVRWPKEAYGSFGIPMPGVTMDDLPIESAKELPKEPAMPPADLPSQMEKQPLHRKYGGPDTKGVLCTCSIGEDHSENGVRLNRLPDTNFIRTHRHSWGTDKPSKLRAAEAIEKLADGLTNVVNERLAAAGAELLINELHQWATAFQRNADNIWSAARTKGDGLLAKTMRAESATWAQAASYLHARIGQLKEAPHDTAERQATAGAPEAGGSIDPKV